MILRIDDYPSGIRPIQDGQIAMFDWMLDSFNEVYLGIVPYTYHKFGCKIHETHTNIIPCCHGYNHRYDEIGSYLIKKNDPFNRVTVEVFDEFHNYSDSEISLAITIGKEYLEYKFGCEVETYIPVCNVISPNVANIIHNAGFRRIMGENSCKSPIPIIKSDYYGKLDDMEIGKPYNVISLHITWEWDTIQEKGWDYWVKLVNKFNDAY